MLCKNNLENYVVEKYEVPIATKCKYLGYDVKVYDDDEYYLARIYKDDKLVAVDLCIVDINDYFDELEENKEKYKAALND